MTEASADLAATARDRLPALAADHADPRPVAVYLARLDGIESRRTMRSCLDWISSRLAGVPAEMYPWYQLRYDSTSVIRALIAAGRDGDGTPWSPSHINKHLSALRGVLGECWRLGLMTAEDYHRARDVANIRATRKPAGRSIHGEEVAAMLAACQADANHPLGLRDAALIAVLYRTGIRRQEAASLLIERYDSGERALRMIGKSNKERTVFLIPEVGRLLGRWLAAVSARRGAVFRPVDRWGNIASRAISARAVGTIVSQRRNEAGLQPLSTHDFRRTFIGDFIDAGGDLAQAQALAGHASATTTAGYDRRPERALRAAVDELTLPSPESS